MTKQPLTFATAQSYISADVEENGREVRRLMTQARQAGADLIHFTEGALSGYVKKQIKGWEEVDWASLRRELEATAHLAGELGIWTVLGCNHRLTSPHRPHNSLYIISAEGELHTRYDKQWCSHAELSDWYTPGQDLCVFELDGWRFGCAICIEIQFPELFLAYARKEVDCMLFSPYPNAAMFGIQAQGYAASHNIWFSVSVPAQMSHILSSRMIAPNGELQEVCGRDALTFALSVLDPEAPELEISLNYAKPWRREARAGNIYRSLYVTDPRSEEKTKF